MELLRALANDPVQCEAVCGGLEIVTAKVRATEVASRSLAKIREKVEDDKNVLVVRGVTGILSRR